VKRTVVWCLRPSWSCARTTEEAPRHSATRQQSSVTVTGPNRQRPPRGCRGP
jgi:hypothetical protein